LPLLREFSGLDAHKDSILLLDEPGLSLHPLAQEDLSKFFDGLSGSNQLVYTTHSPFLVDADHLERVKAVFVGGNGTTRIAADLKAADQKTPESKSIYPVFAALGLSVSKTLLLGCKAVIVEGPSDQFYLSAIKNILIGKGLIKPAKEILFIPAWGVRGVKAVISILTGIEEELPSVILDSDKAGVEFGASLLSSIYKGHSNKIAMVGSFSPVKVDAEIEDLLPAGLIAKVVDRQLRADADEDFSDYLKQGEAIIPQIEQFAAKHKIALPDGWKVDSARLAKQRLMKEDFADTYFLERWRKLFEAIGL
jgi:predicted ATP-dependent endonuclease of OLD family